MPTSPPPSRDFAEKLRILQLETLYDLALALHAHRPEKELIEELVHRVCAVVDPAAAVVVTRGPGGGAGFLAAVGWTVPPEAEELLDGPLWRELVRAGQGITVRDGRFGGRSFRELLAVPLAARGVYLGYLAVLDKEQRAGDAPPSVSIETGADGVTAEPQAGFDAEDRRFLDSVAALAGLALEGARQVESLRTERSRLAEENRALRGEFSSEVGGTRIVAHAPPMRRVLERVERVAPRNVAVVVRGDSGTGKELIAKLLHLRSGRDGSLVAVNCGALPESLLESELFGIVAGVATGVEARKGKFELADGGTLFLDEIGDMAPALQVKLLRALQEREIVPVGSDRAVAVDVRLVTATHRDLESLVTAGEFREDLYYRLRGVEIELPPLRDRREDIPHLVRYFSEAFASREGIEAPRFEPDALSLLMSRPFPGNVRELQNIVEASASLADGPVGAELIRSLAPGPELEDEDELLDLASVERRHIGQVLERTGGNKSRAAEILRINRRTLQRKGF